MTHGNRQREIERWIKEHAPEAQWLAIDDREDAFHIDCPHLFLVPGIYDEGGGIDEVQAELLKTRLASFLGVELAKKPAVARKVGPA